MDILTAQVAVCSIFGLMVGVILSVLVTDRKNPVFTLVCGLLGVTTGIWFSVAWIFLTGGTSLNAFMLITVTITTIVVLLLVLSRLKTAIKHLRYVKSQYAMIFSVAILVALAMFLVFASAPMYTSIPVSDYSAFDNTIHGISTGTVYRSDFDMSTDYDIGDHPVQTSISVERASLNFPFFKSDPSVGDYVEFTITFNVGTGGSDWTKPYIKVVFFRDMDNSGTLSTGDRPWASNYVKLVTNDCKWRGQTMYLDTSPYYQLHALGIIYPAVTSFPLFHANTLEVWQNDDGKTFQNTPEGYTSPVDQMSWQSTDGGDTINLMEGITSFASINKGSSSTVKAKIYCPSSYTGKNFLWVGTYDLDVQTDWLSPTLGTPFSSKLQAFTISGGSTGPTVDAGGPYSGDVGETITFTGSASGGTSPYTEWKWVFSTGDTKYGQSVTKSFGSAGTYSVTLTVTDSAGKTGTDTASITISGGSTGPTVEAGGPYSGTVGQYITFSGSASGGTPPYSQWKWVFSDGDTKYGQSVTKSFGASGSYTATLTVTDSAGKTGTDTAGITITGGGGVEPEVGIDVATYVIGGSLTLGCLGAIVYGKKYL